MRGRMASAIERDTNAEPGRLQEGYPGKLFFYGAGAFEFQLLVTRGGGVSTDRHKLRNDADRNFLGRESANVETHGSIDAFEFGHVVAFLFEGAVDA